MSLIACGNNVVIKRVFRKISSQIIVPENFEKFVGESYGEIISVGENCPFKEDLFVGDVILYRKDEGTKIETPGDEFIALKSDWVLGVVDKRNGVRK